MEYKIKKLQSGGGFATFTPIINAPASGPATANGNSNNTSQSSAIESSSIIDEKMLEQLYKKGGLVNDVNQLVAELIQLEKSSSTPYLQGQNRSAALKISAKINEINQTKVYWDKTITRSKESGGFGETAVDTYGRVFIKNKDNKIEALSLQNYSKQHNYQALTVQELMYERQYNPSLTNQNAVFTVADNAIGVDKIIGHIQDQIKAFGKEEYKNTSIYSKADARKELAGMIGKEPTDSEMRAMSILNQVISGSSEYSKVTVGTSTERGNLQGALKYIWSTLGDPAKRKLSAVATINGTKVEDLIMEMLVKNSDNSNVISVLPESDKSATGKSGESDNSTKDVALSMGEVFHGDKLYKPGVTYTINNPTAGVQLSMATTGIGPLYTLGKETSVIEPSIVANILTKNNYQAILDKNNAFIGDDGVDPSKLGEMIFSGDDVAKVYVPIKADGSPDLAGMEKFKELYKVFEENKNTWTSQQAEKYFANNDFPGIRIKNLIGLDSKPVQTIIENNIVKPFLAMPILTNSASDLSDNSWMLKLTGEEADNATALMNRAFTIYGGTPSKPTSENLSPRGVLSLERPFKGTLFIAYRPEANAVLSTMHNHLYGEAASETDLYTNLNNSSNNNNSAVVDGNASVLGIKK